MLARPGLCLNIQPVGTRSESSLHPPSSYSLRLYNDKSQQEVKEARESP